jgi:Zn-dependent peptidase ImmA (M78 family)
MRHRRGFKADTDRLVRSIRADFGCSQLDALDPFELAVDLRIPVLPLSAITPEVWLEYRGSTLRGRFHAATLRDGSGYFIVHDDEASVLRQRSNLAHELGHIFLEHDHPPVNSGEELSRDVGVEAEAQWFGFALLVPAEAALALARSGMSDESAAERMGVSVDAARYRLNVTGARRRAEAERQRRLRR